MALRKVAGVNIDSATLKVGQLADLLGLTVRTLHHYDSVGLVRPSARTGSGHRLYTAADVRRLYQVVALRQLGLSLDAIGAVLGGSTSVEQILDAHYDALLHQLESVREAATQVSALRTQLARSDRPETGAFLEVIRKVVLMDQTVKKYFDADQLTGLEVRHQHDPDATARVEQGWAELLPEVDAAIAADADPAGDHGQDLASRWDALLEQFHGGDEGLRQGLLQMQAENAEEIEQQHGGPTEAQIRFITAAHQSR